MMPSDRQVYDQETDTGSGLSENEESDEPTTDDEDEHCNNYEVMIIMTKCTVITYNECKQKK